MKLFIAEKPKVANAIANVKGISSKENGSIVCSDGDIVTWCYGHMLEAKKPAEIDPKLKTWSLEHIPFIMRQELKIKEDAKQQYTIIKNLLAKADTVVNAGDADDEGQLLIDEILEFENFKGKVERVLIRDFNPEPIKKELATYRDNKDYVNMGKCAYLRSVADYNYGLNFTRLYTLKTRQAGKDMGVVNVGRVITPMINLILERQRAIESHQEHYFYNCEATFNINDVTLTANYVTQDSDQVDDKKRLISEDRANEIQTLVLNKNAKITQCEHKDTTKSAPMPHNITSIQAECSRQFGFKADKTLKILQSLYETHLLISYPRVDCKYLYEATFNDASNIIAAIQQVDPSLSNIAKEATFEEKHKCFNDKNVTAHTAIIPTENSSHGSLSADEAKVYNLIAKSFIAVGYKPAQFKNSAVTINVNDIDFKATNSQLIDPSWQVIFNVAKKSSNDDILKLNENDSGQCVAYDTKKGATKPPKYYTDSTLIEDLPRASQYIKDPALKAVLQARFVDNKDEIGGIGTPATRSKIIDNAFDSQMIEYKELKGYKEKIIVVTDKGKTILDIIDDDLKSVDLTARWASIQSDIMEDKKSLNDAVSEVNESIIDYAMTAKSKPLDLGIEMKPCPKCDNGKLIERTSTKGTPYLSCNQYPACDHMEFKEKKEEKIIGDCPKCHTVDALVERFTKAGNKPFHCCKTEECDYIKWIDKIVGKCPKCESNVIELLKKDKSPFHKCSNADCDHIDWLNSKKKKSFKRRK